MKVKFCHQIFQSHCVVAAHLPLLMHCFNTKQNTTHDQTLASEKQQPTRPKWYLSSRFIHKPSCMTKSFSENMSHDPAIPGCDSQRTKSYCLQMQIITLKWGPNDQFFLCNLICYSVSCARVLKITEYYVFCFISTSKCSVCAPVVVLLCSMHFPTPWSVMFVACGW